MEITFLRKRLGGVALQIFSPQIYILHNNRVWYLPQSAMMRRQLLHYFDGSSWVAALNKPFWNNSTEHVCLECSSGFALDLKTTISGNVTSLIYSLVNVKVTTCPRECFGVVGLCIRWVRRSQDLYRSPPLCCLRSHWYVQYASLWIHSSPSNGKK